MPRLLGWRVAELDPAARKTLEVALHTGSAGALALLAWRQRRGAPGLREAGLLALTFAPPAVVGLALERPIEQRFGSVETVAVAQIGAGAVLWLVDRRDGARTESGGRSTTSPSASARRWR